MPELRTDIDRIRGRQRVRNDEDPGNNSHEEFTVRAITAGIASQAGNYGCANREDAAAGRIAGHIDRRTAAGS